MSTCSEYEPNNVHCSEEMHTIISLIFEVQVCAECSEYEANNCASLSEYGLSISLSMDIILLRAL